MTDVFQVTDENGKSKTVSIKEILNLAKPKQKPKPKPKHKIEGK